MSNPQNPNRPNFTAGDWRQRFDQLFGEVSDHPALSQIHDWLNGGELPHGPLVDGSLAELPSPPVL
ncbi:MAG: hypothetical protein WC213_09420, partial [Arenimonas sp.]